MEPNIPDGSIVLIKEQNTIDDRKVGAFFYNGQVYCKYITHEGGGVRLCSYNNRYHPIEVKAEDELRVYGTVVDILGPDRP